MSNTLFPIKSQPIDWKPATLLENVLQTYLAGKVSDNLKRVIVKNPYEKTSVLEFLFNEIAGINSRLASLVKKSLHQRHLPVNKLELLQRFYRKVIHELRFFHKTEGCVLQGFNFIRKLVHHRLFSQNIVF